MNDDLFPSDPAPAQALPPRRKRVEPPPVEPPVEDATFAPKPDPDREPGVMPSGKGWARNEGKQPRAAKGKRAVVKLRNGRICGAEPVSKETPAGWLIDGTRWTLTGEPFDVEFFRRL